MGSLGNPQTWVPYDNVKDCSQGFCSLYCPQWCYIIFPPPPPIDFPDDDSGTNFSPLVIAIIGILASAFLLISYYTVISKYCGNFDSLRRGGDNDTNDETNDGQNPANNETWHVATMGLDESLIKSITVCKYKKNDGFIEGTDCSVCLSEFEEDESLRLLPKCNHAFHLSCIDTWLKSHSNCPLCRANVVPTSPLTLQLPPPTQQSPSSSQVENNTIVAQEDHEERNLEHNVVHQNDVVPKTPTRAMNDVGDIIIEIRDEAAQPIRRDEAIQPIRRSVSMDASCDTRVSVADIMCISDDEGSLADDHQCDSEVGTSSESRIEEHNKNRSRVLHRVASPTPMKRSFSSGRFLFTRQGGRGKNVILPL